METCVLCEEWQEHAHASTTGGAYGGRNINQLIPCCVLLDTSRLRSACPCPPCTCTPKRTFPLNLIPVRVSDSTRGRRPSAMSSACAFAAPSSCPALDTTPSSSPSLSASASLMGVLVSIIWIAFLRPTRRGRRWVPPNPGMMPSCSSGRPRRAPVMMLLVC